MRGGGFDLPHHEELAISTKNLTFAIILFSTSTRPWGRGPAAGCDF